MPLVLLDADASHAAVAAAARAALGNATTVLWSRRPVAWAAVRARLSAPPRRLRFNHLPGIEALASKPRLARLLRGTGLLPATFVMPVEWAALAGAWARAPAGAWIRKAPTHRGVRPLDRLDDARGCRCVVQRRVRPAAPALDVGLYALLAPPRACVHRDVLLRVPSRADGIVEGTRYTPAWRAAALAPHMAACGGSARCALSRVAPRGNATLRALEAAALRATRAFLPRAAAAAARVGVPLNATFEWMRLDFMLDAAGRPWLLEANASPSMRGVCAEDARVKAAQLRDLLRAVDGARPAPPAWSACA